MARRAVDVLRLEGRVHKGRIQSTDTAPLRRQNLVLLLLFLRLLRFIDRRHRRIRAEEGKGRRLLLFLRCRRLFTGAAERIGN